MFKVDSSDNNGRQASGMNGEHEVKNKPLCSVSYHERLSRIDCVCRLTTDGLPLTLAFSQVSDSCTAFDRLPDERHRLRSISRKQQVEADTGQLRGRSHTPARDSERAPLMMELWRAQVSNFTYPNQTNSL